MKSEESALRVTVALSNDEAQLLREEAASRSLSVPAFIAQAIRHYLGFLAGRRENSMNSIRRNAPVLEAAYAELVREGIEPTAARLRDRTQIGFRSAKAWLDVTHPKVP